MFPEKETQLPSFIIAPLWRDRVLSGGAKGRQHQVSSPGDDFGSLNGGFD